MPTTRKSERKTKAGQESVQNSVKKPARKRAARSTSASSEDEDVDPGAKSDAFEAPESESEPESVLESDALDDETESKAEKKRKRASPAKKAKTVPKKKRRTVRDNEDDFELEDGEEIAGVIVQAPKTGRVPPGQISQNTLDFLAHLKDPKCNDREWFQLHNPVFRLAEKEFKEFVEKFTDLLTEVDSQVPPLPPKDVIHRIYRDVRFSNDKTPYKTWFSATFSRSGRKGIFAGYHIILQPDGATTFAAGTWCPGKNELATIRNNLQRSSARLRRIISRSNFVSMYGEPKPPKDKKGDQAWTTGRKRANIFGREDELKVAPKGISKDHKDIDLFKCRSFVVSVKFSDQEVKTPDFNQKLKEAARVAQPFVHYLNDLMTIRDVDSEDDGEDENEDGEGSAADGVQASAEE